MTATSSGGLSVVVAYKLGKAAIELLALVAVLALLATGRTEVGALAPGIHRHWLHGMGALLGDLLRVVTSGGHEHLVMVALGGDAVTSALEGILLWRGFRGAPWVVLGATALPLPWELARLVRQPSLPRLLLLVVNLAILVPVLVPVWRSVSASGPADELRVRWGHGRLIRRGSSVAVAVIGAWLVTSYRLLPLVERHGHLLAVASPAGRRTTDPEGRPADPINVGMVAEPGAVQLAFQRAGWLPARPVTISSALGILGAITLDRSDRRAPVSDLFLDGRRQDLAFERQVGPSPRRRHHVRLWEQAQRVNGETLWLGAASFDEGVTISRETGQLTHRSSPDIDQERDTLVRDLDRAGCVGAVHDIPGIDPRAGARTADGRLIETDGRVAVVLLSCGPGG